MGIDETANKELKKRIFELNQELEVVMQQQSNLNDDDVIVKSEIETIGKDEVVSDSDDNYFKTPMGADPNSIALESLNEEREKLSKSKQNIENKVNKMENEIDKLQN